jgi:hypothetical protein
MQCSAVQLLQLTVQSYHSAESQTQKKMQKENSAQLFHVCKNPQNKLLTRLISHFPRMIFSLLLFSLPLFFFTSSSSFLAFIHCFNHLAVKILSWCSFGDVCPLQLSCSSICKSKQFRKFPKRYFFLLCFLFFSVFFYFLLLLLFGIKKRRNG